MGHRWFGSKATSGLWQALIALMPAHAVYIETHLGGGAVMKRKPAALRNIGIDLDARALSSFECAYPVELVNAHCHGYLAEFAFDGSELLYCDPPYLLSARKSGRRYRHDYDDADHAALLGLLKGLPCAVMVSGYPSALYDELLRGWRSVSVQARQHPVRRSPIPQGRAMPGGLCRAGHAGRARRGTGVTPCATSPWRRCRCSSECAAARVRLHRGARRRDFVQPRPGAGARGNGTRRWP